ncbi:MAG: hypothetical protein AAF282_18755 [Cyanobacteria bacterium P01_A01_bin.15]
MTAAADSPQNSQEQVLQELRALKNEVTDFKNEVSNEVSEYSNEVSEYKDEVQAFNQKFDTYQKATQWVVQLAFSLIAAATVTVIISTVTGR